MRGERGLFDYSDAIVRSPSRSVVNGLRDDNHPPPSHDAILAEHDAYVAALRALGVQVEVLPPLEDYPDAVFVEDVALVFGAGAVRLRPGAPSRAGEVAEIAAVLERRFPRVIAIDQGHVDGGDVLVLSDRVVIGLSGRTDRQGAAALVAALDALGLRGVVADTPRGVLHFKTACALVDEGTVFVTPALAKCPEFAGLKVIVTPPAEDAAANLLRIGDTIMLSDIFPRSRALIEAHGVTTLPMAVSEIAKLDAGLSCMSLRWRNLDGMA